MAGSATQNDPLVITTAAQLAEIADLVNRGRLERFIFNDSNATVYLKLGNDIDLSLYGMNWNNGKRWIPIGTYANPFKGHFDGNGKTITGLYINDDTLMYAGLFGAVRSGNIQALALESVHISGNDYTGGVAGGVFENSVIKNCYSSATVSGTSKAGGVAGFVENSTMESCYSTGEVKCSESTGIAGGVAGEVKNGTVKNCAAFNSVVEASGPNVGRIAGHNEGILVGNAVFSGMTITINGSLKTPDSNPEGPDGEDITAGQIKANGTIGNRFTAEGG